MSAHEETTCPRCGFEGPPAAECPRCGIVYAKYRSPSPATPIGLPVASGGSPSTSAGRASAGPRYLAPLVLLLGVAAALAYWTGRPEDPAPGSGDESQGLAPAPAAARPAAAETAALLPAATGVPAVPAPEAWSTGDGGPPAAGPAPEPEPTRPRYTYVKGYGWLEQAAGFDRGLEDAVEEGRILTLYVYTDWCPYCRRLERSVLSDAAVQECLAYSVKVKVNPERGAAEKRIADTFGARAYPSLYLFDPESGVAEKVPNRYEDSSTLLAACRETVG